MERREFLVGAGVVALAGAASAAGKEKPTDHSHDAPGGGLVEAAADCLKKAEACLSHCLMMLGTGDTSMAACSVTVRDTIASSRALITIASAGSKNTKTFAKACADICRDCEVECRKHADKMPVCRACGDACAKMIQEVSKLA